MVVAVLVGLLIGLSLGALGGGGSILTVPALVYLVGQDAKDATTGSLVIVGLTSLIALIPHARAGRVRFLQGLVFGALGIAGSFAGSALAAHVPSRVLLASFAALMLVVAVLMFRRSSAARNGSAPDDVIHPVIRWRPFHCDWVRVVRILATATGVGLLTGFFGVGGGFVLVPALVLALEFSMPVAVGTSLLVIAVNSATALTARLGQGISLDWGVIALFTAAAILGSLAGGRVASRLPAAALTRAFSVLLVLVALGVGGESLLRWN
ncbi:MAG: sulfite exporter TauE/SafE family protein [Tetrasphaera sp.]